MNVGHDTVKPLEQNTGKRIFDMNRNNIFLVSQDKRNKSKQTNGPWSNSKAFAQLRSERQNQRTARGTGGSIHRRRGRQGASARGEAFTDGATGKGPAPGGSIHRRQGASARRAGAQGAVRAGQKHFRARSTLQARRRRGAGTYTWRQTPPSQTGMDLVSENSRVQGWGTFVQAAGTEEEGCGSPGARSRVPSPCSHCGPGFCPLALWAGSLSRLLSSCRCCSGLGSWEPAGCFPSGLARVSA